MTSAARGDGRTGPSDEARGGARTGQARPGEARDEAEARLVVVDDEPTIRELLTTTLRFTGFEVHPAPDGATALALVEEVDPDLVVLDVMLPDIDGFAVTRTMRERGRQVPVLFLTARDDTADKVAGLTVGGDDYVTKPFSLEEVVARIRSILRRTARDPEERAVLRYADLELDEDLHEARRAGWAIDLSPTEFALLRYLLVNAGRVLSRRQILDHVWEYGWDGDPRIVESYMSYLRRKVDRPGPGGTAVGADGQELTPLLHTRRGVGYLLRAGR